MTYKPSVLAGAHNVGPPTSGRYKQGDAVMDKNGRFWLCTAGDGTAVGSWKAQPRITVGATPPNDPQVDDVHLRLV